MITILVTETSPRATKTLGDINALTQTALGKNSQVLYEYNLPNCAGLIRERKAYALVIPQGHGDHNIIRNLENYLGTELSLPVFPAFEMGYGPIKMGELYQKWLTQTFKN